MKQKWDYPPILLLLSLSFFLYVFCPFLFGFSTAVSTHEVANIFTIFRSPPRTLHDTIWRREKLSSDQGLFQQKILRYDVVGNPNPSLRRSTSQRLLSWWVRPRQNTPQRRNFFFFLINTNRAAAPEKQKNRMIAFIVGRHMRVKTNRLVSSQIETDKTRTKKRKWE